MKRKWIILKSIEKLIGKKIPLIEEHPYKISANDIVALNNDDKVKTKSNNNDRKSWNSNRRKSNYKRSK